MRGAGVAALEGAGPVLDLSGPTIRSVPVPDRTVALTFDDGPDPTWTPRILAVLRRHHAPATFFVLGAQVVAHPGLAAREAREGHELGAHTFTHVDLGATPGWRRTLELNLTQTALAGAAGVRTALLRPPYSSATTELDAAQYRALRAAARKGYLIVLADHDSKDWAKPGVNRIVANATPSGTRGAIVLMHDGGGNRAQTVQALDRLLTDLEGRGYRFVTVSQLAGVTGPAVVHVRTGSHLQGVGLLWGLRIAFLITTLFVWLAVPVACLAVLRALVLAVFARHHVRGVTAADFAFTPPVSIVVPAYNEAAGIAAAVRSLAAGTYPTVEVIVVDDGSTDDTAAIVEALDEPHVTLVRQANRGKAAALNTGLALATHDIVVTVDADTTFEPETLAWLVQPFRDATVGAVSGNTKVANRGGLLGRWQHIEYVMGFNLDRRMYDVLGCMPTVPGAIGAFRRVALEEVGDVSEDTLAEDTDLTMAINRAGWRIVYEERARAWTEAPSTLAELWRQRYRWCYGTLQSIWKHRGAAFSGHGGRLGRIGLPYLLVFQVLLPLLAPVVDVFALYGMLFLNPVVVGAYWLGFTLVQTLIAVYAFRLDRERLGPLATVPLQQFVYRQVMYLVVLQSVLSALVGTRLRWHKLRRTGAVTPTPSAGRAGGG